MDLEELFADAPKEKVEPVTIGGKTLYVRGMDPLRRSMFWDYYGHSKAQNIPVPSYVVVALGLCDQDGGPTKSSHETNLRILATRNGEEVEAAAGRVLELSGLKKGALEEAEKNATPAGAPVPVPAGVGSRKDRRAAAARSRKAPRRPVRRA